MKEQKITLLEAIGFIFFLVGGLAFVGVNAWHLNYHRVHHHESQLTVAETIDGCDVLRWTNPETKNFHYFLRCNDK